MRFNRKSGVLLGVLIFTGAIATTIGSCVHAPYVLPLADRTNAPGICFESDILPVFVSNCARPGCHNASSAAAGYVLDNYANVVRKGIVPGNVAASRIWESVDMHIFDVTHMPANAPDLTAAQLNLIRQWIAAGAVDSGACQDRCDSMNFTFSGAVQPMINQYCRGCHNGAGATGGSLADYASIRNAAVSGRLIGDIEHLSGYNAMPLGGAALSNCQVTQVTKWVEAGAPDN